MNKIAVARVADDQLKVVNNEEKSLNDLLVAGLNSLYDKVGGWFKLGVKMLPNVIVALLVVVLFWILSKFVYRWAMSLFEKTHFNESLENLIASICKVFVICLGIIFALGILDLQKTVFSLLAGVGVVGLALGFAFQDLASNFIAGVMLAIRAPIRIGDVIRINGIEGTVIDLRLRDTHIRNFDGQDIYIPNKDFTTNAITNFSSFGMRKIAIEVGIGYQDDPAPALKVLQGALEQLEGVLKDPEPCAFVTSFGDSSVNLVGHVWFDFPGGSFLELRSQATMAVKKQFEEKGFTIPFPIRTLDLSDEVVKSLGGG